MSNRRLRQPPEPSAAAQSKPPEGSEPKSWWRGENLLALCTAALVFVGIVQGIILNDQWKVARRALLDDETPQVRMLFSPLDFNGGRAPETMLLIHQGSRATLFNGMVSGAIRVVTTKEEASDIWHHLEPMGQHIVMGPDEDQSFTYHWAVHVPPGAINALMFGKAEIMVAGMIEYPDTGGRTHRRFACTYFFNSGGKFVPDACDTPPQS